MPDGRLTDAVCRYWRRFDVASWTIDAAATTQPPMPLARSRTPVKRWRAASA